ncbi:MULTISPECIES: RNA 2',3'-cyclic phosphodiesterase [Bacillaceae]|uniref:RNA 2',3'-cyclic phosphodiesterase n=1 Tax=Bacillaceae TaxID=186817 RepID=UPI001187C02E|nr:RNA 2',3'-cyclic phosphodiesterase [Bacillus sp. S3]QCJ43777.1 RNA 2',3'-cyclic phosphodiesterase [Bacillus sp. S3]
MDQRTHFFFAVKIPNVAKEIIKDHIGRMKGALPFGRWVHHQDLHITLAFLGAADPEKLAAAEDNVKEALRDAHALKLKINKLGVFGREDAPRVFWADTEENSELREIRQKVFSACVKAGFQLETRPFRPHITLARKWMGDESFQLGQLEIWNELQPEPLPFQANEVVLYQTHLNQSPKYEAITLYPLQT